MYHRSREDPYFRSTLQVEQMSPLSVHQLIDHATELHFESLEHSHGRALTGWERRRRLCKMAMCAQRSDVERNLAAAPSRRRVRKLRKLRQMLHECALTAPYLPGGSERWLRGHHIGKRLW